jgi:tRNA A-37 threonylcarbamoyl transferase component Bud32
MPKSFVKRFQHTPYEEIRREARLQRRASAIGLSPKVVRCTNTTIVMEDLATPSIADVYGDSIDHLPEWIREEILGILYSLYTIGNIEYIDVTPYNFIEKDGVVWIIDFGHARECQEEINPYLDELFANWSLTKWNPEFQ